MKSRKIILIIFVVIASVMGLATVQDNIFEGNQIESINEISSEEKTITIEMNDGISAGQK